MVKTPASTTEGVGSVLVRELRSCLPHCMAEKKKKKKKKRNKYLGLATLGCMIRRFQLPRKPVLSPSSEHSSPSSFWARALGGRGWRKRVAQPRTDGLRESSPARCPELTNYRASLALRS